MKLEWFLFVLILMFASALVLKSWQGSTRGGGLVVIFLGVIVLVAAVKWDRYLEERKARLREMAKIVPREGRPDGYVSSKKCQACHPGQYESWHRTFHRTMTQFASAQTVLGDFNDKVLELEGETFHLYREKDGYYVEMLDPVWRENERLSRKKAADTFKLMPLAGNGPRKKVRVGLLTGSHTMQVYWLSTARGNMQMVFPFAWLISDKRWVPFHETFLRDPAVQAGTAIWNYVCIRCHSTGGQPRDEPHTDGYDTRAGELGIACEACHGPAEKHVSLNTLPFRRYQLHEAGKGDASIIDPVRLPSKRASEICGQCHSIKWTPDNEELSHTGFRFRPGDELNQTTPVIQPSHLEAQPWFRSWLPANPRFLDDRFWADGEVRVSGREFNGLIDSPCYQRGELSCLSCHSMHQSNPEDQLSAGMDSNGACLQCHKNFESKILEHTHHAANSSGSLCYNCHMPHTTYGLLKNIRSHRISSPKINVTLETGRPNACNLCHLDKTLEWAADYLSRWYKQPKPTLPEEHKTISSAVLLSLKGDAGQRALMAWHMGWKPARRASGEDWLAPYLAQLLVDPYSAVRYIAARSARSLIEAKDLELDFVSGTDAARLALTKSWSTGPGSRIEHPRLELLITDRGQLDFAKFNQLLHTRDDRSMDLQE